MKIGKRTDLDHEEEKERALSLHPRMIRVVVPTDLVRVAKLPIPRNLSF